MGASAFAAIDLGASSGRVVLGEVGRGYLTYREVHRFANGPVRRPTGLHWDVRRLYDEALIGLARAATQVPSLDGIGIDSWAIDYGLLEANGELLIDPYCYRDDRTANHPTGLPGFGATDLYAVTGLQHLSFATCYQLAVEPNDRLARASTMLLIPDLMNFWLTGQRCSEMTNASTTGLFNATTRSWSGDVIRALSIAPKLLAPLVEPGQQIGAVRSEVATLCGLRTIPTLYAVGSHDTASAVVAIPAENDEVAYISCGTWGLVGVELDAPVLTDAAHAANFTNELGVDGRIRFLRNVTGLWLLQQCEAEWERAGVTSSTARYVAEAAVLSPGGPTFDVDLPVFSSPGDMCSRIADECRRTGQCAPSTPAEFTRVIIDSLAAAFAATLAEATALSGKQVNTVHLVGGGANNHLLCQLTADACGLPVVAGPVEATSIGNLLVQARAAGAIAGDLGRLRQLVRDTHTLPRFEPRSRFSSISCKPVSSARWFQPSPRVPVEPH